MRHPEGQDEIHRIARVDFVGPGPIKFDPVAHPRPFGAPRNTSQHRFLNIGGNDLPPGTYALGHRYRKIPDARPHIQHLVPRPDKRTDDPVRILNQSAQPVVKREAEPTGTEPVPSKENDVSQFAHGVSCRFYPTTRISANGKALAFQIVFDVLNSEQPEMKNRCRQQNGRAAGNNRFVKIL